MNNVDFENVTYHYPADRTIPTTLVEFKNIQGLCISNFKILQDGVEVADPHSHLDWSDNVFPVTTDRPCDGSMPPLTCSAQGGNICQFDETCAGSWLSASDSTRCCSTTCITSIQEDINLDGVVNVVDLQICIDAASGFISNTNADVNGDGQVDQEDTQNILWRILGFY